MTAPIGPHDRCEHLRHDVVNPLTTIRARAQLMSRSVRQSPSLTDEEQLRLLASLASIESAVLDIVEVLHDTADPPRRLKI